MKPKRHSMDTNQTTQRGVMNSVASHIHSVGFGIWMISFDAALGEAPNSVGEEYRGMGGTHIDPPKEGNP